MIKENYKFNKIDTKEKAYCLGFILADSCIINQQVELTLQLSDKIVLEFIKSVIKGNVDISNKLDKSKKIFPRARLIKKINDVTKFTGGSLKKDRHYPIIRKDLEMYMLLGFFDGDGCLTWGRRKDKNRIWQKISFTSQLKLLQGVQQYLIKQIDISTIIRPKSGSDCFVLEFANKRDVIKFCEHIYSDKDFIILKRKYEKFKALRLELEENGESHNNGQYRAEPTE